MDLETSHTKHSHNGCLYVLSVSYYKHTFVLRQKVSH